MDYIIKNTKTKEILKFDNGDFVIYGNIKEAKQDLKTDEIIINLNNKTMKNTTTILEEVKAIRRSALEILKIKKVNSLLENIKQTNKKIKQLEKEKEARQKRQEISNYELEKELDKNHPAYENNKKLVEELISRNTKAYETAQEYSEKEIEKLKDIRKNYNLDIKNIESGKTKFKLENINKQTKEVLNTMQ